MKKIIALALALVMALGLVACGSNGGEKEAVPASALEILETVWNSYGEEDKFFVMGGDYTNPVDGNPGEFSLSEPENVTAMLLVPAEQLSNIDGAASMVHAMMQNNFTCGAFHVTGDAAAFADAMNEAISNNQWMCGMPEKMLVAVVGGEYVVAVYGLADVVDTFQAKLTAAYPKADLKYTAAITG